MHFRISPLWWPVLAIASPILIPWLVIRNRRFKNNRTRTAKINLERINQATQLELPELEFLELSVLVDWRAKEGFIGDAGISYLFKTNLGSILYDIGFGSARPALIHNAAKLNVNPDEIEALTISHLHGDHMGGMSAQRARQVVVPDELIPANPKPCFLPDEAVAKGFNTKVVKDPQMIGAGIASIGPLARSLFIFGYTQEQALLARIKGKGLVLFTGCGHPTIEVILKMVRRLTDEPLYAIGGGLHFPITEGRGDRAGIKFQTILGTGKPPWRRITDSDLSRTIAAINNENPRKVLLSGHDTCDYALDRMKNEFRAQTEVIMAGATYKI